MTTTLMDDIVAECCRAYGCDADSLMRLATPVGQRRRMMVMLVAVEFHVPTSLLLKRLGMRHETTINHGASIMRREVRTRPVLEALFADIVQRVKRCQKRTSSKQSCSATPQRLDCNGTISVGL
ncbi:MAG: hypothetical protein AAFY06_00095 [Pseudomonadota bacterium]